LEYLAGWQYIASGHIIPTGCFFPLRAGVLEVFDLLGRRLLVREVRTPGPITLDLASFAPGVYLLRFGREARVLVAQ
jgi:hypothetical protein